MGEGVLITKNIIIINKYRDVCLFVGRVLEGRLTADEGALIKRSIECMCVYVVDRVFVSKS